MNGTPRVKIAKDGPYLVYGTVPLTVETIGVDAEGGSTQWRRGASLPVSESYALCRCGGSSSKPFCDGTHKEIGFDGAETASREPFAAQAEQLPGPTMLLEDAQTLCAFARFCDRAGTIWTLIEQTDRGEARQIVAQEAADCPSGRLVVRDRRTGAAIEPELQPSIGLIEDPAKQCSGPLWVRGGIPIEAADGTTYEARNRVTLCRCGASQNKPFCDGQHADVAFDDGLADASQRSS